MKRNVTRLLEEADFLSPEFENPLYTGTDALELFDHFMETTDELWIGPPQCLRILREHGPRLAMSCPYLLHAMLSFSAYHLSFLHPGARKYSISSTLHYDRSLKSYSTTLQDHLESTDSNGLLACSMLLGMIAFRNISVNGPDLQTSPDPENSLAEFSGLQFISGISLLKDIPSLGSTLDSKIWQNALMGCGEGSLDDVETSDTSSNASKIMDSLEQLCECEFTQFTNEGPYVKALNALGRFMQLEIDHDKIGKLFMFIRDLDPRFVRLLERKEPKALLLLCYWFALLSQIDQWWIIESARNEGLKLLNFLGVVENPSIQDLLRFPAELLQRNRNSL